MDMDKTTKRAHDLAIKLKNSPVYVIVMTDVLLAMPEDARKELELNLDSAELKLSVAKVDARLRAAKAEMDLKRQAMNAQPRSPQSAHKASMGWKLIRGSSTPYPRAG